MKRDSHNPITGIESFLNAITMMDIDVNIKYTGMVFEKLEDGEDNVINIAETCDTSGDGDGKVDDGDGDGDGDGYVWRWRW